MGVLYGYKLRKCVKNDTLFFELIFFFLLNDEPGGSKLINFKNNVFVSHTWCVIGDTLIRFV